MKSILISLIVLYPLSIFGWGSHYLVTHGALSHADMAFTDKEIPTEELSDFVKKQKDGLAVLFKEYYTWLKENDPKRIHAEYLNQSFNPEKAGLEEFLRATRLNPNVKFPLVNRLLPGQKAKYKVIQPAMVSKYLVSTFSVGFAMSFEDVRGKKIPAKSVLVTFADEPDWGMDHTLWPYAEYGYGEQPYGKPEGESSKAPFHMQFMHEGFMVKTFAGFLIQKLLTQRVELFSRLAKFAFANGHEYWGYRFTAWAMHYVQDLGQPYHAVAVPHAGTWYYIKFAFSFSKDKIKKNTTQLVANRHFVYEDFISTYLEKFHKDKDDISVKLVSFLSDETGFKEKYEIEEKDFASNFTESVSEISADHAEDLDEAIVEVFGPKITEDVNYDLETDKEYSITAVVAKLDGKKIKILLDETGKDFQNTGKATRTLIRTLRKP